MAAYGWGSTASVADWLFAEGYRFDFYQAVRLLELSAPAPADVGESTDPIGDPVRFHSRISQSFPASDIAAVTPAPGPGRPPLMEVNFMGIAGAFGPLPVPYTDVILGRLAKKDRALKEFLDLFNHRLVSLAYRIRKTFRMGLEWKVPEDTHAADYLFALVGLGTPGLRHRLTIPDLSLVSFGGLMAGPVRSLAGLEQILRGYFHIGVAAKSCLGGWRALDAGDHTRLGRTGANRDLGGRAMLGTRIWDQQRLLQLTLGPLSFEQFQTFLPTGWGYHSLKALTEWYVGPHRDVQYVLDLQPDVRVPGCVLSSKQTAGRLGWTAWLSLPRQGSPMGGTTMKPPVPMPSPKPEVRSAGPVKLSGQSGTYASPLTGLPLFTGLPLPELAEISRHLLVRRVAKGTVVVRQGEPGEALFIIQQGKAEVIVKGTDGKERAVATLGKGEFFGEMALLTGRPRAATVIMLEDGMLYEFDKERLQHILQQFPRIRRTLTTYVRKRSRALSLIT